MRRAIILVMDSLGIGAADDAPAYGDAGADTLGHIAAAAAAGRAHDARRDDGPLCLPHLAGLGLAAAHARANDRPAMALGAAVDDRAAHAHAGAAGRPKGSTGGHWEMMGLPVTADWGYFGEDPAHPYPSGLIDTLVARAGLPGVIVLGRASGTQVIADHGDWHCARGWPIVYTSADSVLQIAAHEQAFGLERLLGVCEQARGLCDAHRIARVIARPFVGETRTDFRRTENRRDYAMPPPCETWLDRLAGQGITVTTFGKIADLFAHRSIHASYPATGLAAVFDGLIAHVKVEPSRAELVFVNFCDFDSHYGHRRDVTGYAHELERFDAYLPELLQVLGNDDLLIVTADHGNDPTHPGTDHTRENVPILLHGRAVIAGDHGFRGSLADIGATAAAWLGKTCPEPRFGHPIALGASS